MSVSSGQDETLLCGEGGGIINRLFSFFIEAKKAKKCPFYRVKKLKKIPQNSDEPLGVRNVVTTLEKEVVLDRK